MQVTVSWENMFFLLMPILIVPAPGIVVWGLFPLSLQQYQQTPLSSKSFCGDKKMSAHSYEEAYYSATTFFIPTETLLRS